MSYIQQIIGNNIRKYRELNKLTLEKLAEKIDISYQNLSKIENGKGFLKADTFEKICSALNISPKHLVALEGALPPVIIEDDDIKPLLMQIINNMDKKKIKAFYNLTLAFINAID